MSSTTIPIHDIPSMTVAELKTILKERGASIAGKKADLVSRLEDIVQSELGTGKEEAAPESIPDSTDEFSDSAVNDDNKRQEIEVLNSGSVNIETKDEGPIDSSETETPAEKETPTVSISVNDEEKELKLKALNAMKKKGNTPRSNESNAVGSNSESGGNNDDSQSSEGISTDVSQAHTTASADERRFVRIDYLQRPCNNKQLHKWLEEQCECTIDEAALWTNSIKTHCYVDFHSNTDAKKCVERVTGQKYPSTSTATLEVNFTSISALDAATSAEATMKPGEWKNAPVAVQAASPMAGGKRKADVLFTPSGSAIDMLRKAMGVNSVTVDPSSGGFLTQKRRIELGLDSGAEETAVVSSSSNSSGGDSSGSSRQKVSSVPRLDVDSLFRKTEAVPQLYWEPAPSSLVEERLKKKLAAASAAAAAGAVKVSV